LTSKYPFTLTVTSKSSSQSEKSSVPYSGQKLPDDVNVLAINKSDIFSTNTSLSTLPKNFSNIVILPSLIEKQEEKTSKSLEAEI
jgi:hypothetical protein